MVLAPEKRAAVTTDLPAPPILDTIQAGMPSEASKRAQTDEVRGQIDHRGDRLNGPPAAGAALQMFFTSSTLQAMELRSAMRADAVKQAATLGVSGAGTQYPHQERIEQSFGGTRLGNVRAFIGGDAGQACQTIGARAYTSGDRVGFKDQPDLRTAAHEAAHVVQQRNGVQLPDGVGAAGDAYEQQADAVASAVVQGRSAQRVLGLAAGDASQIGAVQADPENQPDPLAGLPTLSRSAIATAKAYNEAKYAPEGIQQIRAFLKASNPSSNQVDDEFCRRVAGFQQAFESPTGKLTCKTFRAIVDTGLEVSIIKQSQMPKARTENLKLPLPLFYRIEEALGLPKDGRITDRFIHRVGVFQRLDTPSAPDGWLSASGSTVKCLVQKRGLSLAGLDKGPYADYRRMLEDGVFDVTIGAGYDESNLDEGGFTWDGVHIYPGEGKQVESGITGLGFQSTSQAELQKAVTAAGASRTISPGMKYFIKKDHYDFGGRKAHITLTYIPPRQGTGKARSAAFLQGLGESDAAIYSGHGRYQTGPDFDRNFTIQLQDNKGAWHSFLDYGDLEKEFEHQLDASKRNTNEAKEFREKYGPFVGSTPLAMLQNLQKVGRFKLVTSNEGNLVINPRENAGGEFGLWLITQAINDAQKGAEKELISPKNIKPDRYRLWVFSGCNTIGYVKGIRKYAQKTGGEAFNTDNLDLLVTKQETWVILGAEHALSYLAGLMGMESVQAIQKRFEADEDKLHDPGRKEKKGVLTGEGFKGNPTL